MFNNNNKNGLKKNYYKGVYRSGANEKIMLVTTSTQVFDIIKKIKSTRNWGFSESQVLH